MAAAGPLGVENGGGGGYCAGGGGAYVVVITTLPGGMLGGPNEFKVGSAANADDKSIVDRSLANRRAVAFE